jgi:hypothetical protein
MHYFEMYVEILAMIKELEPECFRHAVRVIKQRKFTDCKYHGQLLLFS